MIIRRTSDIRMPLIGLMLVAITVTGCISFGPSMEEQLQAMSAMEFSPNHRYAVVARNSNAHGPPTPISVEMADVAASNVASIVADILGVQAEALSVTSGSPWERELARARDATGWIEAASNVDFFRDAGYDGYVLITLWEGASFTRSADGEYRDDYVIYNPVFHIISLPEGRERIELMQAGQTGSFRCDLEDIEGTDLILSFHLDPKRCAAAIAARFRNELAKRR